ncbi:MAG: hypothetical protein U0X39_14955 [Bacteroidales bacterium]
MKPAGQAISDSTAIQGFVIPELADTGFLFESLPPTPLVYDDLDFGTTNIDTTGIYTFRGGSQRNTPVLGRLDGRPLRIRYSWSFTTGSDTTKGLYGVWGGGAGWTGQPLYVKWDSSDVANLGGLLPPYSKNKQPYSEIIQASLDGNVYFLDFEKGKRTRKPLEINNPIKGTPSINGWKKEFILVGQGIDNRGGFAWRLFDLRSQKKIQSERQPDSYAIKKWGACDASPLVDPVSGVFIWPMESGLIYRGILGRDKITNLEKFRYRIPEHDRLGTESSPSAFRHLGYITDNAGNIICIDLQKMIPRWRFFNTDDSDATPVINMNGDSVFVLVGNEVDKQGSLAKAYLRKLDGLSGRLVWQYSRDCYSITEPKTDNGGLLSTPLPGKEKATGLIWAIFSRTNTKYGGAFVCLNDSDGSVRYELKLKYYSWVSPIALYDREGNPYIYFADVAGNIFLLDGLTGKIMYTEKLKFTFESSPVAIGNRIIQPARGNRIISFVVE